VWEKIKRTQDVRNAGLSEIRKRIGQHVDLVIFDIDQPLRRNLSNLAHALFNVRRQRIQKLFDSLLGPAQTPAQLFIGLRREFVGPPAPTR
jgi:hypothetical protein